MTRAFFPIRRAAQWPKGGGTGIALALISAMATPLASAGPYGHNAGTNIPGLPVGVGVAKAGQDVTLLSDSFAAFVVDRVVRYYIDMYQGDVTGILPGQSVTFRALINAGESNDRLSFRIGLTGDNLPFENWLVTYDSIWGSVVPGPTPIAFSDIGTDISASPQGLVTVDLEPDDQIALDMTAEVPAATPLGTAGTFRFWTEPLVPQTSLAGTPNPDAYSLMQGGSAQNTLSGVETHAEAIFEAHDSWIPDTGAFAMLQAFAISVPEITFTTEPVRVSTITDPAICAGAPNNFQTFSAWRPGLPGACVLSAIRFKNEGATATDDFPLVLQVPPGLTYVGLILDTGLVDGPAAGVGPVIIDADESGGPCSATSLSCEVRIEDASLPAGRYVHIDMRGLIR